MTFQPVLLQGGVAGWRFLQKTAEQQKNLQNARPEQKRATQYFKDRITTVLSADQLVQDRQLREVALTSFGLASDIDNKYFIQKVLSEGTLNSGSLANKLSDNRYAELSDAFGFGNPGLPRTQIPDFPEEIIKRFEQQRFEESVGVVDPNMRLALSLERELGSATSRSQSNDAQWFSIMGSPPLRRVFEGALSLPSSFGRLDVDSQLTRFKSKAAQVFGTDQVKDFQAPEKLEQLRDKFLSSSLASSVKASSTALEILRSDAKLTPLEIVYL